MIISSYMDLSILAAHMGSAATLEDAVNMRDTLIAAGYDGQPVSEVPESRWLELMNVACGQ